MFDANLRCIPKGRKFFGKVHSCSKGKMFDAGVRTHDILRCEMMSDDNDNPLVRFTISGKFIDIRNDEDFMDLWVVYEGRLDGTDFIDKESKRIAMKMINEGGYHDE